MTKPKRKRRAPNTGVAIKPTELQRKQVRNFAAYGMSHENICRLVFDPPIQPKTLRKHFRRELDLGVELANVQVVESLHLQAVGAPAVYDEQGRLIRAEQPRVPSAGIWWTKARLGWKESSRHELTGKDGAPLIDLTKLTDAELDLYEKLVRKGSAQPGPNPGGTGETRH